MYAFEDGNSLYLFMQMAQNTFVSKFPIRLLGVCIFLISFRFNVCQCSYTTSHRIMVWNIAFVTSKRNEMNVLFGKECVGFGWRWRIKWVWESERHESDFLSICALCVCLCVVAFCNGKWAHNKASYPWDTHRIECTSKYIYIYNVLLHI